jgi:hypothetical protein
MKGTLSRSWYRTARMTRGFMWGPIKGNTRSFHVLLFSVLYIQYLYHGQRLYAMSTLEDEPKWNDQSFMEEKEYSSSDEEHDIDTSLNPTSTSTSIPTQQEEEEGSPEVTEGVKEEIPSGGKTCRICFAGEEEEEDLGRLISPCLCSGSMRVSCALVAFLRVVDG